MDWVPVVSTALGAVVALAGAMLTSIRSGRDDLDREREAHRRQAYFEFAAALNAAHAALREVIDTPTTSVDRVVAARSAVGVSGLYGAREHLLMFGSAPVATAAEAAFLAVIQVQEVARQTVGLESAAYHQAYHQLAFQFWTLRMVVRIDVGERPFKPADFDHRDWSELQECEFCRGSGTPESIGAP